jgi:hypothetical protein
MIKIRFWLLVLFLQINISGFAYVKINNEHKPIFLYMKNGNNISGYGILISNEKKPRGKKKIIQNIAVLNGIKYSCNETDSIRVGNITGYSEWACWKFKLITGKINAYWKNIDGSKTPDFISKDNGQIEPFSNSLLQSYIGCCNTALLYTKKGDVVEQNFVKAILDYNVNGNMDNSEIKNITNILSSLSQNDINRYQYICELDTLFKEYDEKNNTLWKGLEKTNCKVFFKKDKRVITGTAQLTIFPIGYGNYYSISGLIYDLTLSLSLFYNQISSVNQMPVWVDGKNIMPFETDSIIINGYTGYPSGPYWRFKIIDGNVSAYSYTPIPYVKYFTHVQKKGRPVMEFDINNVLKILSDVSTAYSIIKFGDSLSQEDYYRAFTEYNNPQIPDKSKFDSLLHIYNSHYTWKTGKKLRDLTSCLSKETTGSLEFKKTRRIKSIEEKRRLLENIIKNDTTCSEAFEGLAVIKNSVNDKESAIKYYNASLKYSYKNYQYKNPSELKKTVKKDKKIRKKLKILGCKSVY